MDTTKLSFLLDDNQVYCEMQKSVFLEKLESVFQMERSGGITEYVRVVPGIENCYCELFGKEGYSFRTDVGTPIGTTITHTLDLLIFENSKGDIEIRLAYDLKTELLNKHHTYEENFSFSGTNY